MMVPRWVTCLLACLLFHAALVTSQLPQDYQMQRENGRTKYYIIPDPATSAAKQEVIKLDEGEVYLVYNCAYMVEICKNARSFLASARGQQLHQDTTLDSNPAFRYFAFDSNIGRSSAYRDAKRRDESCPTSGRNAWKSTHTCPESDQSKPMRQDGPWYTTAVEDADANSIYNEYDSNGNLVKVSGIRYSCEEFPAASWVEGGSGPDPNNPQRAFTRCAPITCKGCPKGTKTEQTWQSTAHGGLSRFLKKAAAAEGHAWQHLQTIAFFVFMTVDLPGNGVAAEVIWESSAEIVDKQEVYVDKDLDYFKRRSSARNTTAERYAGLSANQIYALLAAKASAGNAERAPVHANDTSLAQDTTSPWGTLRQRDTTERRGEQGHMEREAMLAHWGLDDSALHSDDRLDGKANAATPRHGEGRHDARAVDLAHSSTALLAKNATADTLRRARKIVASAIAESARRNEARYQRPARNVYRLKPGTLVDGATAQQPRRRSGRHRRSSSTVSEGDALPPLLPITDEIAQAAALVAEAEASEAARSRNVTRRQAPAGTFWMQDLQRKGTVPWGNNSTYVIFRNVRDYGAVGNGVTDDTAAIKRAMTDGNRCGEKCNGSTTKNAIVYFPPGTYLVSSSIPLPFGTQVIGDANNRPLILAASSFVGLGVLSTDEYTGGGTGPDGGDQQYYINTANFYRQLRNVRIDVRGTAPAQKVACLHYQVAQATSTQNVELIAGAAQTGLLAENGSGGGISDITFTGGAYGIFGGEQQFTAQRLSFDGCTVGVQVIWDWGWVWKSVTMSNVGTGFKLVPDVGQTGHIGSASFLDSSFNNVPTAIEIAPPSSAPGTGTTGVILDNVAFSGVTRAVGDTGGATLLAGSVAKVDHWALGPVYSGNATRSFSMGAKIGSYRRSVELTDPTTGAYFERPKPQYTDRSVDDFVHVKDFGAMGNGVTDDTAAFQSALWQSQGKILYVDAGSYILTSTIKVPTGVKVVGETWSQLVASGSFFQDANNPKALLQVGDKGQIGAVELQDLIITTKGPTAGAVLIEWNMKASGAGLAGMWDVHVRIGGATGTGLTSHECPALTSGVNTNCDGASLMMHITPQASGYFENMWLWLSDHDIDDPALSDASNNMVQDSVYAARGFLIESTHATWLYGTASEHAVFYQYNFHKARNIFAGMIQSESPYYQPTPPPPAPFTEQVGVLPGDPDYTCVAGDEFSGCDQAWGLIIRGSSDIYIAGAGLYSWFSTYAQACIDTQQCQKAMVLLDENKSSVRIQHLVTIGSKYMAVMNGVGITAAANMNADEHPFWSQISVLDVVSDGSQYDDLIWIDPKIWEMEQPQFTCVPPCHVQLPPWTSATSTVDYPLITVSAGTWTSTITRAPMTLSELRFQALTITQSGNARKRQAFGDFWPVPALTSSWPVVVYSGPNGSPTTVAPTVAFPTPPPSIGPGAPPPPRGSWPPVAVRAVAGAVDQPVVEECSFYAADWCGPDLNTYGGDEADPDADYDIHWDQLDTTCPIKQKTSTTTAPPPPPTRSPMAQPHPSQNRVTCFNSGIGIRHADMDSTNSRVCSDLKDWAEWWGDRPSDQEYTYRKTYYVNPWGSSKKRQSEQPTSPNDYAITYTFTLFKNCNWQYNQDECNSYFKLPVDACNCAGVDNKQGGSAWNDCLRLTINPDKMKGGSGGGSPFDPSM